MSQKPLRSGHSMHRVEPLSFLTATGWLWCSWCTRELGLWFSDWQRHLAFIQWWPPQLPHFSKYMKEITSSSCCQQLESGYEKCVWPLHLRPMGTFSVTAGEWLNGIFVLYISSPCSIRKCILIISVYNLIFCGCNWGLCKFLWHTNGLKRTETEDCLIKKAEGC